jgi:hypothetical protein
MEPIKFTQEEMNSIAMLQSNYQEKIFKLGQFKLDEISLEDAKKNLEQRKDSILNEWKELQNKEQELLKSLADKYGDGSLSLKDGTFTPNTSNTTSSDPNLEQTNQMNDVSPNFGTDIPTLKQV